MGRNSTPTMLTRLQRLVRGNGPPNRLVMTLLVRNEADILEHNLRFHLGAGVDFVVATDNGSIDGSVEILERYEESGVLQLLHESEDTYEQSAWTMRMVDIARQRHGADWILFCDADEFWMPRGDSLKTAIARSRASVLHVQPANMIPVMLDQPLAPRALADTQFVRVSAPRRLKVESVADLIPGPSDPSWDLPVPWLFQRQGDKVIARASAIHGVEMGNHGIKTNGIRLRARCPRIAVAHFPIRSYPQFESKVRLGGAALARNSQLPRTNGWHWRRWYEIYKAGGLQAEFVREVFTREADLAAALRTGRVTSHDPLF